MTAHAFSADFVTIQAYAWLIEQDLRKRFLRQRQEQNWITNSYRHMRQVVLDCLEETLVSLTRDRVLGDTLLALARQRLAKAGLEDSVSAAIDLDGLFVARYGLYYTMDQPAYVFPSPSPEDTRVVLSQLAKGDGDPLAQYLIQFSQRWQGDVCRGAINLRTFFLGYLEIIAPSLALPRFLFSILQSSLTELDWHQVAAQVLGEPLPVPCRCAAIAANDLAPARVVLLLAHFASLAEAMRLASQHVPEPQRGLALFLADFCQLASRGIEAEPTSGKEQRG
jgi:hypothetical protein